jgi:hypothetical protein
MLYIVRNRWVDGDHIISAHDTYAEAAAQAQRFGRYGYLPDEDTYSNDHTFETFITGLTSDDGNHVRIHSYGLFRDTDLGEWKIYSPNSGVDLYAGFLNLSQALEFRNRWRKDFGRDDLRLVPINLEDWLVEPLDLEGIQERGDIRAAEEAEMEDEPDWYPEDFMTDAEADADVLRNAGMGTDEDYGYYGGEDY